jgi:hypothetical protein
MRFKTYVPYRGYRYNREFAMALIGGLLICGSVWYGFFKLVKVLR